MKKKTNYKELYKELKRKTIHLIIGITLTIFLYKYYPKSTIITTTILIIGIITSILIYYEKIRFLDRILYYFEREEKIPGRGIITLTIGILLPYIFLTKNIALIAGLAVSIVDSTATIIGIFIEKKREKSIIASITGGFLLTVILSSFYPYIKTELIIIGSITATLIEYYSKKKDFLDDNIYIGIGTGIILYIFKVFLL